MKAGENSLFPLVHDYLKIYLPKQRGVSPNTIRSYRKALEELLDYVKDCKQISLGEVTFDHLTTDVILSFLEYLEAETALFQHAILASPRFALSWTTLLTVI